MDQTYEMINGASLDVAAAKRAQLKSLFPDVFTETISDQGETVETVDFEKLKAELGTFTEIFELRRERYGMDWPGKKDALRLIQTPSAATLKPAGKNRCSSTLQKIFSSRATIWRCSSSFRKATTAG